MDFSQNIHPFVICSSGLRMTWVIKISESQWVEDTLCGGRGGGCDLENDAPASVKKQRAWQSPLQRWTQWRIARPSWQVTKGYCPLCQTLPKVLWKKGSWVLMARSASDQSTKQALYVFPLLSCGAISRCTAPYSWSRWNSGRFYLSLSLQHPCAGGRECLSSFQEAYISICKLEIEMQRWLCTFM